MSTTSEYADRRFDLVAWQGIAGTVPPTRLKPLVPALALPGEGGTILTRVAKMAQRATLILLTERRSLKYLEEIGTLFMMEARQGRWRTTLDVQQSFYASLVDVRRQMERTVRADDPADEILADGKMLSVGLAGDRVEIGVQWVSQAGTDFKMIAPIATVVK
jgi:hypothetical protein